MLVKLAVFGISIIERFLKFKCCLCELCETSRYSYLLNAIDVTDEVLNLFICFVTKTFLIKYLFDTIFFIFFRHIMILTQLL